MIQTPHHRFLDMRKIHHHTILVQNLGTTINGNNPIVTVQILTFTSYDSFKLWEAEISIRLITVYIAFNYNKKELTPNVTSVLQDAKIHHKKE